MKKIIYIALLGGSIAAFSSCSNDNEAEQSSIDNGTETSAPMSNTVTPEQSALTPVPVSGNQSEVSNNAPAPTNAATSAPTPTSAPAPAAPTAAKGDVKLNPAHGQPGHDCAIPVGAPLNSKPATGAQPKPNVTVTPAAKPTTAPANGSGKINPPHGQPGHDCAVPVGSPLPG